MPTRENLLEELFITSNDYLEDLLDDINLDDVDLTADLDLDSNTETETDLDSKTEEETDEEPSYVCPRCGQVHNGEPHEVYISYNTTELWCEECFDNEAVWSDLYDGYISTDDYCTCANQYDAKFICGDEDYFSNDIFYSEMIEDYLYRPWDDDGYYRPVYNRHDELIDYYSERNICDCAYWAADTEQWYDDNDYLYWSEYDEEYYYYESNMPENNGEEIICDYHNHKGCFGLFVKDNEKEDPSTWIGFENEIEAKGYGYDHCEMASYIGENTGGLFVFEQDGSLHNGFECITNITSLGYLEDHYNDLVSVFKTTIERGYRSNNTSNCGLHVHVNRHAFGDTESAQDDTIEKVVFLVEAFRKEIMRFSRRGSNSYCSFRTNEYEWNSLSDLESKKKLVKEKAHDRDRYLNINVCNNHTVEFRMFRGTLKFDTVLLSVVFCKNIIALAKATEDIATIDKFENILTYNPKYANRMLEYYENCRPR